jgi:hypothetical protein
MKTWSSEAIKHGITGEETVNMTDTQLRDFRNSFDPDEMGFDGPEFIGDDTDE